MKAKKYKRWRKHRKSWCFVIPSSVDDFVDHTDINDENCSQESVLRDFTGIF